MRTPAEGKPEILLAVDVSLARHARLETAYTVRLAFTPEERAEVARRHGGAIRAIVTNGTTLLPAELMTALPALGIICAQGAGYEGVDLEAARRRGIVVTHGPGTNADSVADHAMGIMLAALRDIPVSDANVRAGRWRGDGKLRPAATGKRLGLLGLGAIGQAVARRAAGFGMPLGYHARSRRPDSPLAYFGSVLELARWADILLVAAPGGPATRHMVDAAVLAALGADGFLVNVGRGSIVDTGALVGALRSGTLAGAALDVIDGEPEVPPTLSALPNVVLTPHVAGRSPEAAENVVKLLLANLEAFFAGRPPVTPVP